MTGIPEALLEALGERLERRIGLDFSSARRAEFERQLQIAAAERERNDVVAWLEELLDPRAGSAALDALTPHLTVGETYFLRDPDACSVLCSDVIPDLHARRSRRRELNIWSAGCATGEEAYTLAMLLREHLPEATGWPVRILATDLNPRYVEHAVTGVYRDWSLRNVPRLRRDRYFEACGDGRWRIAPEIRAMVEFQCVNLVGPTLPRTLPAMDLIMCRNVLMYLSPTAMRRVVERLHGQLVDAGWLMVSAVETSLGLFTGFAPVNAAGITLYRKSATRNDAAPATRPVAAAGGSGDAQRTAIQGFGSAPAAHPSDASRQSVGETAPALRRRARSLADRGLGDAALACCAQALALDRTDSGTHYLRGLIELELGRYAEAGASLRRALYLEPALVPAHVALGNLCRARGAAPAAARHYAHALAELAALADDTPVPAADGMTAGALRAALDLLLAGHAPA